MNKIPCYNERDSNEHNSHVTIQITHYEQKNELIAVIQFGRCLSGCIWFGYGKYYIYMVSHVVPRLSFILSQSYMHVIVPELSFNLCLCTILYHNLPNQCVFGLKLIEISFFFEQSIYIEIADEFRPNCITARLYIIIYKIKYLIFLLISNISQ